MTHVTPLSGPGRGAARSATLRLPSTRSPLPRQVVALGRKRFVLAWTGIYTLHAVNAAYFIAAGQLYAHLPTTQVCQMMLVYQLTLDITHYSAIASAHYALASTHCFFLVTPIVWRYRRRKRTDHRVNSRKKDGVLSVHRSASPVALVATRVRSLLSDTARCVYTTLFARDGIFGVDNPHFELIFLAREVVETLLQTYQAYTMSVLLPKMKLNGLYTLILVVNCWTTPVLRRVCRGNKPLERLLVVLCDILLDFVSSVGVPVLIAVGYLKQYDPVSTDFAPWTLYYNDVWLLNFMNEAPLVVFGSWLDAASRLIFSLGLLISMDDVKALIVQRPPRQRPSQSRTQSSRITPVPVRVDDPPPSSPTIKQTHEPDLHAMLSKWIHRAMIVWGIGVGVMYLEAQLRGTPAYCSLELRPWLVTAPACAVVVIDCRKHSHLVGKAQDFDSVLSQLNAASVEYVIYRHCPRIEIPPEFLTLRHLYGFKTYNSTFHVWNREAAFIRDAHPQVRFAFFVRTHFAHGELPAGLCHELFPPTLGDIEIVVSNLNILPSQLPWPTSMAIFIESTQLASFPMVLVHLKPYTLSLAFNRIPSIPVAALMTPDIAKLNFRGNPIVELPTSGVDMTDLGIASLFELSVEYTDVSSLPEWINAEFLDHVEVRAAQSPICVTILLNESSREREELLRTRPWLEKVRTSCATDPGPTGLYPLEVDDD